jgi:hypothetical protein
MAELINIQNAIYLLFKNPLSLVSCTKIFAAYINFARLPHILSSIICVSYFWTYGRCPIIWPEQDQLMFGLLEVPDNAEDW